jgi:hypothetical protein
VPRFCAPTSTVRRSSLVLGTPESGTVDIVFSLCGAGLVLVTLALIHGCAVLGRKP